MNNLEIIEASLDDLDLIMTWRMRVLKVVFNLQNKEYEKLYQENLKYYQKALANQTHVAIFAKLNNEIIGCGGLCIYQEMPSPDNLNGLCGYLMNIYTKDSYHNQGVGSLIVNYLVKTAQNRDITKIYLESTKAAIPFYKNLGFKEMNDYLIFK